MMRTRVAWDGRGYYARERDMQGSAENGIVQIGYVWRKCWYGSVRAHSVRTEAQIWRDFEPRYRRSCTDA
jgi:hypothetical protein